MDFPGPINLRTFGMNEMRTRKEDIVLFHHVSQGGKGREQL